MEPSAARSEGNRMHRPTCILLVEDHLDTATALKRILTSRGYQVSVATGYMDTLRIARVLRFDVVLCDMRLPDGHGCNLLAELRDLYPFRAIALTALGMPADVELCREAGFDAFLLKPVHFETLLETIELVRAGVVGLFPDSGVPSARANPLTGENCVRTRV
jgi:two-component system CheB/CheR fusion protein